LTERDKSAEGVSDISRIKEIDFGTMREGSLVRQRLATVRPMSVTEAVNAGVSKLDLARAIARDRVVETMERAGLRGRFVRVNEAFLREKANRQHDPRNVFYKAMLETDTYEAYAAAVRGLEISVESYRSGPINGGMEIRYARKSGWIADAGRIEPNGRSDETVQLDQALGSPAEREDDEPYFRLEHQLRDFLADNLSVVAINGKRLRLCKDATGGGVEYQTAVGAIDILAVDSEGALYVFELKRANSVDRAMGQVTRYMGWVKETIGQGKVVYGVIVARAISDKLKFARTAVPNVYLFEYGISLALRQAHNLDAT
jgi:Endonuclease NucS C-terminal domain